MTDKTLSHLEQPRNEILKKPARSSFSYKTGHKSMRRARDGVRWAIESGKLSSADEHVCMLCYGNAQIYHHWSYDKQHRLDVIPICRSCHSSLHLIDPAAQVSVNNILVVRRDLYFSKSLRALCWSAA